MVDANIDRCVMCGEIVPEGSQVCLNCKSRDTNEMVRCYDCGSLLEVMSCHWYNTDNGHARNTIFHCNCCGSDWEKDEEFVAKPVKFTRKFWG